MPNRSSRWATLDRYKLKSETDHDSASPDDELWFAEVKLDGLQSIIDHRLYDKRQTRDEAELNAETVAREDASMNSATIPPEKRPEWRVYDA